VVVASIEPPMGGRRPPVWRFVISSPSRGAYHLAPNIGDADTRQQDRFRGGLKPIIPATLMGGMTRSDGEEVRDCPDVPVSDFGVWQRV